MSTVFPALRNVPQVEGVNFGVVCPHWPNGFNGSLYLWLTPKINTKV